MLGFTHLAAVTVAEGFSPFTAILYLLVFGGVLAMAYYTTRWVSKSYGRTYGTQIRVVDRLPVGTDRNFLMVRIGTLHYFLYQDKNGVRLLDRLNEYTPEPSNPEETVAPFQELLDKIMKKKQG